MFLLIADSTHWGAARFQDLARARLAPYGEVRVVDASAGEEFTNAFDTALPDAGAILSTPWSIRMPRFTAARWDRAKRLQVIAGTYDNRFEPWIDLTEAARRGVTVADTSRSMTPTVAEFALAMTLNLMRDIPAAVQLLRQGEWKRGTWDQPGFVYGDLTGRRVGLAGFGSINRRYAELLSPFRCRVQAYDPFVADDTLSQAGVERSASLTDLAAASEIFVVGLPPTPATLGIISRDVIDALPRGTLLVLVTRMAVVEQDALWRRVEAGEIRAAVDVFAPEPPPAGASFLTSPHLLPTPHIAGDTAYCHERCFTTACDDAVAVLAGQPARYAATLWDARCYEGTLGQRTNG
jgi:phosphoglycerate dehydrogenase-like enzyme